MRSGPLELELAWRWPRQPVLARWLALLVLVLLVTALGVLQRNLTIPLTVFPLFLAVVALATVWLGRRGGTAIAILIVIVRLAHEVATMSAGTGVWVLAVNACEHLALMAAVVYLLDWRLRASHRAPADQDVGTYMRPTVCSCCSRISTRDDHWVELDAFLAESGFDTPRVKVCAPCARERYVHR